MPAYCVIYQNITNVDRFREYIHAVMPVIDRRGGRLVAQGTPEALEGLVFYQRAVLFEWRSRQALLDFWVVLFRKGRRKKVSENGGVRLLNLSL